MYENNHDTKQPNYALRRVVAIGALGLASLGVGKFIGNTYDRFNGTDVPDAKSAQEHPDKYQDYIVQPNDTADDIAKRFTTGNHDYRNNSSHVMDQVKADNLKVLTAGEHISVPTTEQK